MSEVYNLPEPPVAGDPVVFNANYDGNSNTPIVIDNGSTFFRYGWATQENGPHVQPNLVAKFRDKRSNRQVLLFGDSVDVEPQARAAAKSPWEGDHLNNSEALEAALDFAFLHLGIDTSTVDHPIIMTERLCTLSQSRSIVSEMMFELYSVPGVTYAVDSLMSFAYNLAPVPADRRDGLVLSFNTASTSVVPVLGGVPIYSKTRRLPFGGLQASQYLVKLLQLKYPTFPATNLLALPQNGTWLYQTFSEFSLDYKETLRQLNDPDAQAEKIKTEEELAALAEKRKESGRRLQEEAARRRAEKLQEKERYLEELLALRKSKDDEGEEAFAEQLEEADIESEKALDDLIKKLEADLKRAKKKDAPEDELTEEPTFPLLDVPDEELDEEGLKEKRRQKLNKGLYEARVRMKEEKAKEKAAAEEEARLEEQERENDFEAWSAKLRSDHERLAAKMREREKKKAELSDRKSAANQARMRNIATLTTDQLPARKRRKRGDDDDDFGMDDADFDIYREIGGGDGLSEEEDLNQLKTIETRLLAHDPNFSVSNTWASISTRKSALIRAFCPAYDAETMQDPTTKHQMTLNVERWKVPEAWFTPSMAGVDCAGLGEIINNILGSFTVQDRNVFLTGGSSQIPNLQPRVLSTIRQLLPPDTEISVKLAQNPQLDAWYGMAAFARTPEFGTPATGMISKADYEEYGADRIRTWWGGNPNYVI
ncbi:Nuclear actin-protein involved in chromatin remodeling [Tulasnella sp. 424]|nr:Nuclear actin-protein involved in chromatin remodeling [Tulasnella sp. 424]